MDKTAFKKLFGAIARKYGFEFAFSGWFRESHECLVVLDLQKSNFGNYYYVNIKVYIQGVFGRLYHKSKELVKREIGNIFTRTPTEFDRFLDFDVEIECKLREEKINELFSIFITPFANKVIQRSGIKEMIQEDPDFLLPAVKEEFDKLEP